MRAVIYCRVSTVEQAQNLSLPTQEHACRAYCAREGYDVAQVFVDAGESAKTVDRPAFLQLLAYCQKKAHGVHAVLVHSLTRFSRNSADHHAIAALLRGSGVTLRSATEPIDESPVGKLMEAILAGVAQFDNDVKSARSIEGMKAAVAKGRWVWQAPLGYRPGDRRTPGAPSIEPDPVTAPLIREAFTCLADGRLTGRRLNARLAGLGLTGRKGGALALSRLYAMLRNPVYTGRIENAGWQTSIAGDFQPIVSAELFAAVQQRLDADVPTTATRHRNHPDFPLRRFVRCASCRGPLTGSWSKGRTQRYGFYHCRKGCTRTRRQDLEQAFLALMDRMRPHADFLHDFRAIALDVWRVAQRQEQSQQQVLQKRLAGLQAKLSHLDRVFLFEQRIDDVTYQQQRDELRQAMTLTRMDLRAAAEAEVDVESLLAFAEHVLVHASALWTAAATTDERMRMQATLFPDGLVWRMGKGSAGEFVEPATCLDVFELRGSATNVDGLASPTGPTWNHLLRWLQHMQGAKAA